MPTDYACQAAAEQAARGITRVRDILVPARRTAVSQPDVMPVVLRSYLGVPPHATGQEQSDTANRPAVSAPMGAAVLLVFLHGLQSEMTGSLLEWYSNLSHRLPEALGAPSTAGRQVPSARQQTSGWQIMADLQSGAHEVLTTLVSHSRSSSTGPSALTERLALIEDVLAGVLRRMAVPADTATQCAGELAAAVGGLFGLSPLPATTVPSRKQGP